jgi:protein-S-isoprenylcysteine O-methyltransferase Ste14
MKMKRPLPPTYFLVAVLLMLACHVFVPVYRLLLFPWTLLGLIPVGVGIGLNLAADRAFKTHATTVKPFQTSTSLVTEGVFGFSRNPMYLGMVCILTGVAGLTGTLAPWLVIPVFMAVLTRVFIRAEEAMLAETFGEAYQAYKRRVRRWL